MTALDLKDELDAMFPNQIALNKWDVMKFTGCKAWRARVMFETSRKDGGFADCLFNKWPKEVLKSDFAEIKATEGKGKR
jgi:hypothetical protein